MNDEYDKLAYLDRGRFWHAERLIALILLLLIVGTFIVFNYKFPPVISDKLPAVPVYPGSTLIETTISDPQLMGTKYPEGESMVMEIPTDIYHYKSIGSLNDYSESYHEFAHELYENNWIRAGIEGCQDYVWWNMGYAATRAEFFSRQDDSNVWTLVVDSVPLENKKDVTRVIFNVTKGYSGCIDGW